jgi:hypothetical protein
MLAVDGAGLHRLPTVATKDDAMDWKLELVAVPVSDVDRAKAFYTTRSASRPTMTTG